MPNTSIACGALLVLVGILGYIAGVMNDRASYTALIPAGIGAVLIILGVVSNMKEALRKHLMHAAVVIALLGFIAVAVRLVPKLGEFNGSAAQLSQLATAIICLIFVVLAIRSFAAARRSA